MRPAFRATLPVQNVHACANVTHATRRGYFVVTKRATVLRLMPSRRAASV